MKAVKIPKPFGSFGLAFLTFLSLLFLILMGRIILGGGDQGKDIPPDVIREIFFIANGLLWACIFAVVIVVSMLKQRHWRWLWVSGILVAIRIGFLWYAETYTGGAEDHLYVWFPIEALVYLLWKFPISKKNRLLFTGINLALYGTQLALVWIEF